MYYGSDFFHFVSALSNMVASNHIWLTAPEKQLVQLDIVRKQNVKYPITFSY